MKEYEILLSEVKTLRSENTSKFESVAIKLESISKKINEMDVKLNRLDVQVSFGSNEINNLRKRTDDLDSECRSVKTKIDVATAGGAAGGLGFLAMIGRMLGLI